MARWLLKTEPDCYNWDDLVRDKKTVWDGVANNTALMHIRAIKKGDHAIIYHTGKQRAAIGTAEITSDPYADPKEEDPRLVVFDIRAGKKFARPVTLDEFKADKAFAGWDLIRLGRLSVVPVPEPLWKRLEKIAAETDDL